MPIKSQNIARNVQSKNCLKDFKKFLRVIQCIFQGILRFLFYFSKFNHQLHLKVLKIFYPYMLQHYALRLCL